MAAINHAIAGRGGRYHQQYRHTHGTGLNHMLIAATAEILEAGLITFNQRHFPMVSDLIIPCGR